MLLDETSEDSVLCLISKPRRLEEGGKAESVVLFGGSGAKSLGREQAGEWPLDSRGRPRQLPGCVWPLSFVFRTFLHFHFPVSRVSGCSAVTVNTIFKILTAVTKVFCVPF